MNVLVIGSGGREHTLVWKLAQSPKVDKMYCAPGNAGIAKIAQCVDIAADNLEGLVQFAQDTQIDLTVVGPEVPLTLGIVDLFESKGLRIFGPDKEAAQLEGSKVFTKNFLKKYYIPTASYDHFEEYDAAYSYAQSLGFPVVVKADGLAAGKGVLICENDDQLKDGLKSIFKDKVFGEAGASVVVEEFLQGQEASILAICDGQNALLMQPSQDHKRIFDGDQGPNTGGMGAYCPAPIVDQAMLGEINEQIIMPTMHGLRKEGIEFKGILYAGLMINSQGIYVLEYNVRFGDPETQAVLPRLENDLFDLMNQSIDGELKGQELSWTDDAAVCVVLAAEGYPGSYEKGRAIDLPKTFDDALKTEVFHAGTSEKDDQLVTSGGRVLGVTALGSDIAQAVHNVYQSIDKIQFEGMQFRKDIAQKALNPEKVHESINDV